MLTLDIDPYTVVVSVFVILLTQQIIKQIGKSTIQEFLWLGYIHYGTKLNFSSQFTQLAQAKEQLHQLNKEKRTISAQDEYAKWTKLNRKCDKLTADIASLTEDISQSRASIDKLTGRLIMLSTTLPLWFFRIFSRKTHLFYFSSGIFPWYIERVLSLPFLPAGAVGLTIWMYAVNSVLSNVLFLISFAFAGKKVKPAKPEKKIVEEKSL
ncbi:coiled-coil membrane protein [Spathaspora passalidarum NRRL Y-27907]|uniref:Golgi to ER traffic protein 1 n=1 Tax=Spathaspora passalidarum (strain NRRL Y-27907 / 11-Y1) TaxID=619300 RepID=G3AKC4_SPAPN|nr:coiled-coil membrane protein [Spathaspora passalidarum NRRL Y-27907]EGW33584.1 coiled-coil membrane protein [Spathaspora passalidarum NRRL Y-27907]